MDFYRTHDLETVRGILTRPDIYPLIVDDYAPADPAKFRINEHPAIHYVVVRNGDFRKVGLFCLYPLNQICWEVHVVMLPGTKTSERWAAARQFVPWLERETDCERLTASVPACNRAAIVYGTHGIGLRYVGRHRAAFRKHGILEDLIILGLSLNVEQGKGGLDVAAYAPASPGERTVGAESRTAELNVCGVRLRAI